MHVQQNDPDELLEVFDASGHGTGRSKSRAVIHLDGDWHAAFHCWILRRNGQEVVLQRRALTKDTFAGLWDAAAAGHWRYGESAAEAAREITEELGIQVEFDRLTYRGQERIDRAFPNGLIDREFHEIYVLHDDRPLSHYRPDPAEVIGLAAFPLERLISLAAGDVASIDATEPINLSLSRDELVPYSADRLRRNLGRASRVDKI